MAAGLAGGLANCSVFQIGRNLNEMSIADAASRIALKTLDAVDRELSARLNPIEVAKPEESTAKPADVAPTAAPAAPVPSKPAMRNPLSEPVPEKRP